jgi:putative transposase
LAATAISIGLPHCVSGLFGRAKPRCGSIQNKSVYLALGVNTDGEKELLGIWIAQTEGAKFWLSVMNELKNRGVEDIFIACVDGLKGFPDAIEAVYPKTQVNCVSCIKSVTACVLSAGKSVKPSQQTLNHYGAATLQQAEQALEQFAETWDNQHPSISKSWRENWTRLSVFFDYPLEIRKVIYTTNAIESFNASLRQVTKTRRSFPSDDAVMKLLYLALHQIAKKWTMPLRDWKPAMTQFMIIYGDRVSL